MNRIRKILSVMLALIMTASVLPSMMPVVEAATTGATGTTALFNGNATHLLQERFNIAFNNEANGGEANANLSGWDVDYRGGKVTSANGIGTLTDTSLFDKTSISHQLMKHTGDNLVMESQFQYVCKVTEKADGTKVTDPLDGGFHYTMTGDGKVALDLSVKNEQTVGYFHINGVKTELVCNPNTVYSVKAIFSTSKKFVDVYINGELIATAPYQDNATSIDNIYIGTTEDQIATIKLNYVYVYVNYIVNEQFMGSYTTGWDVTGGSVAPAPGSPYPADPNGYSLVPGDPDAATGDSNVININAPFDSASEVTWNGGSAVVSTANNVGGRNNVIMATNVIDNNNNTVGVKIGTGSFAFKAGDVITYSIDYYSASSTKPQVWIRRHGGGSITNSLQPFRSQYHTVTPNSWNTLTATIPFAQLGGTATEATWTDAGNYAIYIRGAVDTCYLDNFKVTVHREVSEATYSDGILEKKFSALSGKHSFTWNMLVPSTGVDGFKAKFGGAEFTANGGKFYINGQEAYTYAKNVWYKLELRTDGTTAELLVNDISRKSGVSAVGTMNSIKLGNGSSANVIVDDVQVYKTPSVSDYTNYPTIDENPSSDYHLGMVVYPMWREGIHYGWDAITPYEDRTPYQGYYTNGSKEVADWDAKWMIEHGIDHAIYPFVNPKEGEQAKMSVRGEALEGYLSSDYKDQISYAIMMTNPLDSNLMSANDYITNAVPYIVEHHFKNPAYKKIDNKLPVYMYNFSGFASLLGGDAELNKVLNQLDTEAKNLGYAGLLMMVDISSCDEDYITSFKSKQSDNYTIYKWRYSWSTDIPGSVITGIKNDYSNSTDKVASVPMGFDNTPWRSNKIDIMTPEQVKSICESIPTNIGTDDPKIVLFTCWDEWGEGHFWAPSNKGGFGYLNAIRSTLTTSGEKTNETRPSADSVKRMSVLYPEGRQILKIRDDRRIYTPAEIDASLTKLGTIDLTNGARTGWFLDYYGKNRGEAGGCSATATTTGSGSSTKYNYTYKITDAGQASVTWDMSDVASSLSIDLSKVTAIKVKGYAENSSEMVLNFVTSTGSYADGTENQNTKFRFSAAGEGDKTEREIILLPDNPSLLSGTVETVRFNTSQKTAVGSVFDVNAITFYTGALPKTYVYLDQEETRMVSEPVEKNGTTYIPAYQFLLNAGAYPVWDKTTQSLTVEKDDITAVFKAGSSTVKVNGENVNYNEAPYYENGNIYIPYDAVLDPFEYDVILDGNTVNYYNKTTGMSYDQTDDIWDFEIDGNTDNWTGGTTAIGVRDGGLLLKSLSADPILQNKVVNVPKANVNYLVLKAKKTDVKADGVIRLYDNNALSSPSAGGLCYNFTINPSDEVQTFVFKLDSDYNKSRTETFAALGSNILSLRIDPMDSNTATTSTYGTMLIDSIGFYAEDPTVVPEEPSLYDYKMKAYGFEAENLFILDSAKSSYTCYSVLDKNGATGIGDVEPPVETVDGYSAMKLIPKAGGTEGLFNISHVWYKGQKTSLRQLAEDERMVKISFWYKAIGNGKGFRFESRQGGIRDGEEFTVNDASTTEWKYFEQYFDMSTVANASRWFTIRVMRTGSSVDNGGIYLRDYNIVCLDTSKPITTYNDGDTIAVVVDGYEDDANLGKMYISEHDTSDNVLSKISSDNYPVEKLITRNGATSTETSKYFFYRTRSTNADTIKGFLWDGRQAPLSDIFTIEKAD